MASRLGEKLSNLLPTRFRSSLTHIHARLVANPVGARLLGYHAERERVLEYWKKPRDDGNLPQRYLNEHASRQFLVETIRKYAYPEDRILEIGCNVGANLDHLYRAGFARLGGIEINPEAVQLLNETFPEMASHAEIYNAALEDVIRTIPDGAFDAVFTMAVLEHVHRDSEWTFREIVRVTKKYLITIEDERSSGWSHFERNYRKVFEREGLEEIECVNCREIEGLGEGFNARIFGRRAASRHPGT